MVNLFQQYYRFALLHPQEPEIDCFSEKGGKLDTVKGDIVLHNIDFFYPSRPEVKVSSHLPAVAFLFLFVLFAKFIPGFFYFCPDFK